MRRAALVLAIVGCGDRSAANPVPVANHSRSEPAIESVCAGTATLLNAEFYAVQFELRNHDAVPVTLTSYEPFLFSLAVSAAGVPVAVLQPAFDGPVQSVEFTIPAHGRHTIQTHVRLRLAPGAGIAESPFTWTINHTVDGLTAIAKLQLPPPFDAPCAISFTK